MFMATSYNVTTPQNNDAAKALAGGDLLAKSLREWIDDNWFTSTSFQQYAELQPRSLKTIARRFTRAYGVSPKQYQLNRRLGEAKTLLRESTWSLTDIAYECGFYDSAQFSRIFKSSCEITPSTYRTIYAQTEDKNA